MSLVLLKIRLTLFFTKAFFTKAFFHTKENLSCKKKTLFHQKKILFLPENLSHQHTFSENKKKFHNYFKLIFFVPKTIVTKNLFSVNSNIKVKVKSPFGPCAESKGAQQLDQYWMKTVFPPS